MGIFDDIPNSGVVQPTDRAPTRLTVRPQGFSDVPEQTGDANFGQRFTAVGAQPVAPKPVHEAARKIADERLIGPDSISNTAETFGREAINTALLNIPRNVEAFGRSVYNGDNFTDEYDQLKHREEALNRQNPTTALAGTVTGIGAGALMLPGVGGGLTTAARAGRAALTGMGYGAVSEFLDSKDPADAAIAGLIGGGIGLVAAPVAERIVGVFRNLVRRGDDPRRFLNADGSLTDDGNRLAMEAGIDPADFATVLTGGTVTHTGPGSTTTISGAPRRGPTTAADIRQSAADEFGLRLSPGQATNNFTNVQYEQAANRGAFGKQSTDVARNFFGQQAEDVANARGSIQQRMAGDSPVIPTVQEGADTIQAGVRSRAAEAKQDFKDRYEAVWQQPGELHAGAMEGIGQRIKGKLTLADDPVIVDDITTPIASKAIDDLANISGLRVQNKADPFGQPNPENIVGINLRGVDQSRKRLVKFYQAAKDRANATGDRSDLRAMQGIINGFDDELESAMARGLFSGDERVLDMLKGARKSYSDYRNTFKPNRPGDDAGRAMEKIVERDATAGEIANLLYGKSAIGEKGVSVRLAERMKKTLGEDSDEWNALKQGLWMRLTAKPEGVDDFGPQQLSKRIFQFINGDGSQLAKTVFTPAEIAEIRRFAGAVKYTIPPPGAVNHSGSGYFMSAAQGLGLGGGAWFMGLDPQTAGTLAALRFGAKVAKPTIKGWQVNRHFEGGVRPDRSAPNTPPKVGVGAGLTAESVQD